MRNVFYLCLLLICNCTLSQETYTIDSINHMDDGNVYINVTDSKNQKGIIIETNDSINKNGLSEIKSGHTYNLNLTKIDKEFRGRNDKYVLISSTGKNYDIWTKEDGHPLVLYKANNLNGLVLKN